MLDSMLINLVNPNKDIEINGWKEVTSTLYFIPSTSELHPEGMFSEEIFGAPGTEDRKTKWGWVRLNDVFMNPHAFYVLKRLKKGIANDMKLGIGRYYVDKTGELTKIDPDETVPADAIYKNTGTGITWLKEAWPYISWRTTNDMSKAAKIRRKWLKAYTVDEIFWDKLLIMPAWYRDVKYSSDGSSKRNIINQLYAKILRLADIIKNIDDISFMDDPNEPKRSISHVKMQDALYEIYEFYMKKIGGADGFANKFVVGKATDYGARLVISPPDFNTEHYTQCEADFFHSSTPLATAANIFAPFMIFGVSRWIQNYVSGRISINYYDFEQKKLIEAPLDSTWIDEFTTDSIRNVLDNYKKSKHYRVEKVTLKGENGFRIPLTVRMSVVDGKPSFSTDITEDDDNPSSYRELTYCELLYIVAMDNIKNKSIYNTRYPLTTYNNTYCGLMNIIPCNEYTSVFFNGVLYPRYPILNYKTSEDIEGMFTDTMRMFSTYLAAMGADYDGDQISTQGVFTQEGNEDVYKHMKEISNVVGINGNIMREFPNVIPHGIYGLTYMIPKPVAK